MMILMDRGKLARADGKVVKAGDFAHLATAQETLAQAYQRAAEIVALAESQRDAAIREGRTLGIEQGRADYAASMVEATARMDAAFICLEARLVKTVIDALQSILHEIGDRTVMERLVRRTIANSSRKNSLRLIVASAQFETVNELLGPVLAEFPEIDFVDVVKDPAGVPGMCVLESEFGIVDASLDTQIAAIRAGLVQAFVGKRRAVPAGR
jgi:type III secretion protein L